MLQVANITFLLTCILNVCFKQIKNNNSVEMSYFLYCSSIANHCNIALNK